MYVVVCESGWVEQKRNWGHEERVGEGRKSETEWGTDGLKVSCGSSTQTVPSLHAHPGMLPWTGDVFLNMTDVSHLSAFPFSEKDSPKVAGLGLEYPWALPTSLATCSYQRPSRSPRLLGLKSSLSTQSPTRPAFVWPFSMGTRKFLQSKGCWVAVSWKQVGKVMLEDLFQSWLAQ